MGEQQAPAATCRLSGSDFQIPERPKGPPHAVASVFMPGQGTPAVLTPTFACLLFLHCSLNLCYHSLHDACVCFSAYSLLLRLARCYVYQPFLYIQATSLIQVTLEDLNHCRRAVLVFKSKIRSIMLNVVLPGDAVSIAFHQPWLLWWRPRPLPPFQSLLKNATKNF